MGYAFSHNGRTFTPDGEIDRKYGTGDPIATSADVVDHNREEERKEIEWLKTSPDRVFLYVRHPSSVKPFERFKGEIVTTWLGTVVGVGTAGPRKDFACFGPFPSHRRSIDVRIYGVRYVGWYFESSGNYCRLKKSTRQ